MHLALVKQPLQQDVSLHPRALTPKTSRNVVGWGGGGGGGGGVTPAID